MLKQPNPRSVERGEVRFWKHIIHSDGCKCLACYERYRHGLQHGLDTTPVEIAIEHTF